MNRKIYWKMRKRILNILFKCKVFAYKSISKIETSKNYAFFGLEIAKKAISGLIRGIIIAAILLIIDGLIIKTGCFAELKGDIFVSVIIGCLSVIGVILGLYCANISSIYSSKYSNAPETVSHAFHDDKLTQRCIGTIINYIIFGFIVIVEILINCSVSFGTLIATIFWTILVIISYSIAGNRAYRLADIYSVADDSYRLLNKIIIKNLNRRIYSNDTSFQNHFQKISECQINLLKEVQRFGESSLQNNNAAMERFMFKNISLVRTYWEIKSNIARDSYWFRNIQKYQKWHLVDNMETSIALSTGTYLRSKTDHDYYWLENEIFSINQKCIICLCETKDLSSLYTYLSIFPDICEVAIINKEVKYFVSQINYLRKIVEKLATDTEWKNDEASNIFAGIVEQICLLYLGVILESGKYYKDFDIKKIISNTIDALDTGKSLNKCKLLRGNEQSDFYNKIITEIQVEKKRLTPDWLIAQNVAREAYIYMNDLQDAVTESIDNVFKLGQYLYDKKLIFEACLISMRFYEYESKLSSFIDIIEDREKEFSEYHIDQAFAWAETRTRRLKQTIEKWRNKIPTLLFKCSSEFAIKTWEMGDKYPDFLGGCYNYICDDAVEAIIQDNATQFQIDFENLSKLILLYQEYIRADFLRKKDVYSTRFEYYVFTSPVVELAQIGGLAILWGEFKSNVGWRSIVDTVTTKILGNDSEGIELAEKFIEYIQNRDGIGYWYLTESKWKQKVAQAIRESEEYQIEYYIYGKRLKTENKLLNAFCKNFVDMGFTIDPSEVYCVLCINPMLPEEKKFHTKYSWEDSLND